MRRFFVCALAALMFTPPSAYSQEGPMDAACPTLVQYRDTKLFQDYELAYRLWEDAKTSLTYTSELRQQLKVDARWQEAAEIGGTTVHMLNLLVGALNTVLDAATFGAQGAASEVGQAATVKIVQTISRTGSGMEAIQAQTNGKVAAAIAGEIPVMRGAVRFFQGLEEAQSFSESAHEAKRVLNGQLASVETSLKRIEAKLRQTKHADKSAVKAYIDKKCGRKALKKAEREPSEFSSTLPTGFRSVFPRAAKPARPADCAILRDTTATSALADNNPDELNRLVELCN